MLCATFVNFVIMYPLFDLIDRFTCIFVIYGHKSPCTMASKKRTHCEMCVFIVRIRYKFLEHEAW